MKIAAAAISQARDIPGGEPWPRERVPAGSVGHADTQAGGVSAALRAGSFPHLIPSLVVTTLEGALKTLVLGIYRAL